LLMVFRDKDTSVSDYEFELTTLSKNNLEWTAQTNVKLLSGFWIVFRFS